jgi:hypothetical protein
LPSSSCFCHEKVEKRKEEKHLFFVVVSFSLVYFLSVGPLRLAQGGISRVLGSNTVRKVLIAIFIILAFLVIESYQEMRHREKMVKKEMTAN